MGAVSETVRTDGSTKQAASADRTRASPSKWSVLHVRHHRAQWTKTSPQIDPKWSIQHVWPVIVLNGPKSKPGSPETR